MKKLKTDNGVFVFVEIPNDAIASDYDIDKALYTSIYNLKKGEGGEVISNKEEDFKIISTFNDISNDESMGIVDIVGGKLNGTDLQYKDYLCNGINYSFFNNPKKSLKSLIEYHQLDLNKNYLILKKL